MAREVTKNAHLSELIRFAHVVKSPYLAFPIRQPVDVVS